MSPFGVLLRDLRLRAGMRQTELAQAMGYEQTYWSALETGTKGPPPLSFVQKLANIVGLDEDTLRDLTQAIDDSYRHMTLPVDAPTQVFRVFGEFRRQVDTLHPVQLALIEQALSLRAELKDRGALQDERPRIRRRYVQSLGKEGAMT
ncbi:MAG: helix-turn-helix transcriptional regulator [Propionivibrio sp.]